MPIIENNYDQEIEQYLLAGLLENNHAIYELNIEPNDFYVPAHSEIYKKMLGAINEYGEFDYSTFCQWAKGREFIDGESGEKYIQALQDSVLTSHTKSLVNYGNVVHDYAVKRRLRDCLIKATNDLNRPDEKIHDVIASVSEALKDNQSSDILFSGHEVYGNVIESLSKPKSCFSTGLDSLDKTTAGGFYSGWTYGFCGAEKSGKTMLATTLAYNATNRGSKVLYIALEMGSTQIEQRSIARQMGFNSIEFFNNPNGVKEKMRGYKPNENMFYMDLPGATLDEILLNVSKAKVKYGIDGFIVDYWQLVRGGDSRTTEEKHLRDVAQGISDFARKNNLFNILLAQMNQDGKLFGGNGLRKACDQLYMIEQVETNDKARWLRMDASRYTLKADIGSESSPSLEIQKEGPYFKEIGWI
jgi:replicative DNA helicase